MSEANPPRDAIDVARHLAAELQSRGQEYALGDAIALGYWAAPRGTLDVDLTLFISPDQPGKLIWLLREIGCEVVASEATEFLREHGFCRAQCGEFRVDVFVPISPFYDVARQRRQCMDLEGQAVMIWDAESLAVFKMMFFRDKDFVDIRQMLRTQGTGFDRVWVRQQLEATFGTRDPRLARWDELTAGTDS